MRKAIFSLLLSFCCLSPVQAADARDGDLPKEVVINEVEFVHVPAGWFWFAYENNNPPSLDRGQPWLREVKVWLDGYYIAKYEARARHFKRFMNSGAVEHREQYGEAEKDGCAVRRHPAGDYFLVDEEKDLPATQLSWELATEFAGAMGFRLPTEMEWVKAARGTDRRLWPWGDEYPDDTFAGYSSGVNCNPAAVDAFPNGKSPYGAYNMAGNVYEFVQDWYNDQWDEQLKDGMRNPPLATHGTTPDAIKTPMKVLRGGRWSSGANGITVYRRSLHYPAGNFVCFGTRFALDEAAVRTHLEKGTATIPAQR